MGATPGILDNEGIRILEIEESRGLFFLKGFVESGTDVFAVEVDRSLTEFTSGNDTTVMSENYGIHASDI